MKIKCPQCDFENEEGIKFCKNCNEPLYKQDYSEDNPYIKKRGNEDQSFKLISDEEASKITKNKKKGKGKIFFRNRLSSFSGNYCGNIFNLFFTCN